MDHPSRQPSHPLQPIAGNDNDDHLHLPPDPEILRQIAGRRVIWSPWHGRGRLVGSIGYPPQVAHVAEFERLDGRQSLHHAAAFWVLN